MKKSLIILALILLVVVVAFWYAKQKTSHVFSPYTSTALHDREVQLDPASQKIFDARIAATKKSIAAFNKDTSTDDKVSNYFNLAGDEQALGHYQEAKKAFEAALLIKHDAHITHAYAALLYQMGAGVDAFLYLDEAIKEAPEVPNFWQTKIQIAQELYKNDADRLEEVYLDGLTQTKEDIDLLTLYATYLANAGRREESILYWKKAITKNPTASSAYQAAIDALK